MTMQSVAFPDAVDISPGGPGSLTVAITNTSPVIDAFNVEVFGLDPSWVEVAPAQVSLFPGQTGNVDVRIMLPEDHPATQRTLTVNVVSTDDPAAFSLNEVLLAVHPRTTTSVRLDPVMVTSGRRAKFGLVVSNVGNAPVLASGFAIDPEDLAQFDFTPPEVVVPPGREQVIEIVASGGRHWFGQARARTFTFGVDAERRVETMGTFIQRPRIGRWLFTLLGLLTAAAIFAAVLSRTFDRVVDEARVSPAVLDAALQQGEAGGAVVPTNPGTVSGVMTSTSTGQPLSGVQAELFIADSADEEPIATAATDADGAFTFANLGEGEYLLRVSGAGLESVWYAGGQGTATPTALQGTGSSAPVPGVKDRADATPIEVELGQQMTLPAISVGGTPVDVPGQVAGDDPTAATVSVIVPGAGNGEGTDPVVATATPNADGSFVLEGVPSPGTYQLVVEQPGSPPSVRDLVLEPGRPLADVSVVAQPGSGIISGSVTGPSGPIGGATITASDGTSEVTTVSLTESPVGTYEIRNLPTPGQYTVSISSDRYAPESRTVVLATDQPNGTFDAVLAPAVGSISGRASISGAPPRGIRVDVNGGGITRTSDVISQGAAAGTFSFTGLAAPATYTLTFSGEGLVTQVRVVDLDPNRGSQDVGGVAVTLARESSNVRGVVRSPDGRPVGQAEVILSDGATERTVLTSDDPVGQFAFTGVTPGAYTLTARRTGTEPVVILVNVAASAETAQVDVQLGPQASVTGIVTGFDPAARSLPVRLFAPEQFPRGEPLAVTTTGATGAYEFTGLDAPVDFVVAVYATDTAADPLDSVTIRTQPGQPVQVPTITVDLP
jgi:hypothetical protein